MNKYTSHTGYLADGKQRELLAEAARRSRVELARTTGGGAQPATRGLGGYALAGILVGAWGQLRGMPGRTPAAGTVGAAG